MEYVKINSLWKRKEYVKGLPKGSHGPLVEGDYSEPEFGAIKYWSVDEKIDGMNIRIYFSNGISYGPMKDGTPRALIPNQRVEFHGRTNEAQLPPKLLEYLHRVFTVEALSAVFPDLGEVILYGEGYGPKIQSCGGNYRKDQGFILFDVVVGSWWLQRLDVQEIAEKLGVAMVPQLGFMNESEIVEYVKSKPKSLCSLTEQVVEGVVCRSHPLMLFRNGSPIMWKLKTCEFQ